MNYQAIGWVLLAVFIVAIAAGMVFDYRRSKVLNNHSKRKLVAMIGLFYFVFGLFAMMWFTPLSWLGMREYRIICLQGWIGFSLAMISWLVYGLDFLNWRKRMGRLTPDRFGIPD